MVHTCDTVVPVGDSVEQASKVSVVGRWSFKLS